MNQTQIIVDMVIHMINIPINLILCGLLITWIRMNKAESTAQKEKGNTL